LRGWTHLDSCLGSLSKSTLE